MNIIFVICIVVGSGLLAGTGVLILMNDESEEVKLEYGINQTPVPTEELSDEIDQKLQDIEKKKSENEYTPKDREWIKSGPFEIDRSEYVIGEKIFLRIGGLSPDEKGQITFMMPLNQTHYKVYFSIPFDGTDKMAFNYYLEPQLSAINGYCTVDDFVGDWRVVFRGTDYRNLEFKIIDKILPGEEADYEPVC